MSALNITIPNICTSELKYTVNCIFKIFLGVEYTLKYSEDITCSLIEYESKIIKLPNHFFRSDNTSELFCKDSMPNNIILTTVEVNNERHDFVNMYGSGIVERLGTEVRFDTDIFAASFFMLSRWEELVSNTKDKYDRFPAHSSIAYQNNFLQRPIVNEYVEIMWALLVGMGYRGKRKSRTYTVVPTHDVDYPKIWTTAISKLRSIAFSTLKDPNLNEAASKIKGIVNGQDLYNTFDTLMSLAEENEVQANFNFMAGGDSVFDSSYELNSHFIIDVLKEIKSRGHNIGFHPSYNSYNNEVLFKNELAQLQIAVSDKVESGRQHYLRFSVPSTWQIWEESKMEWDSTMGYAEEVGFRCGVCYPFPVFDIEQRKQLTLIERPLLVMDVTLAIYKNLLPVKAIEEMELVKSQVKKYCGEFVFLWHNSSFTIRPWQGYNEVLEEMYN